MDIKKYQIGIQNFQIEKYFYQKTTNNKKFYCLKDKKSKKNTLL
jgi:hypothetical protein